MQCYIFLGDMVGRKGRFCEKNIDTKVDVNAIG